MNYDRELELLQAKKECASIDAHYFDLQKAKIESKRKLQNLEISIKEVEAKKEVASMRVLEVEDLIARGV